MGGRGLRVTIVDVARAAGVSIATVSHVLNGTKPVSADARARVETAVSRLDYRPSHLARGLRRRRTATVGLLLSRIATSPIHVLLKGLVDALAQTGDAALLADSEGSEVREAEEIRRFMQRQIDGLIFQPVAAGAQADQLVSAPVPCVAIEREMPPGPMRAAVLTDYASGVADATRWALTHGLRTGFVATHVDSPQRRRAFEAYVEEVVRSGRAVEADLVCTMPPTPEGGYKAIERLRRGHPEVGAAIIVDPLMAAGAIQACEDGEGAMKALTLIGADAGGWPPSATVRVGRIMIPSYEIGRQAVQLLKELSASLPAEPPAAVPQTSRSEQPDSAPGLRTLRLATQFIPPRG